MTNDEIKETLEYDEEEYNSLKDSIALAGHWLDPEDIEDPVLREYFNFLEASINVIHEYLFENKE